MQSHTFSFFTPRRFRGIVELDRTRPSSSVLIFFRGGCCTPWSSDSSQWLPSSSLSMSTPRSRCSVRRRPRLRSRCKGGNRKK